MRNSVQQLPILRLIIHEVLLTLSQHVLTYCRQNHQRERTSDSRITQQSTKASSGVTLNPDQQNPRMPGKRNSVLLSSHSHFPVPALVLSMLHPCSSAIEASRKREKKEKVREGKRQERKEPAWFPAGQSAHLSVCPVLIHPPPDSMLSDATLRVFSVSLS